MQFPAVHSEQIYCYSVMILFLQMIENIFFGNVHNI